MRKHLYILFLLLCCSCNGWFSIEDETAEISSKKAFQDEASFYNALIGVYSQLSNPNLYGDCLSIGMLEYMGQNFTPDTPLSKAFAQFEYNNEEAEKQIASTFQQMYKAIGGINQLIAELEKTTKEFYYKGQKEIILGEAYALRGALHFDLMRLFHPNGKDNSFKGIPYMKQFGAIISAPQDNRQLLDEVEKDLEKAFELLKGRDPILNGLILKSVSFGQIDNYLRTFELNYYAVAAIQARVYLYEQKYQEAYEKVLEVFSYFDKIDDTKQIYHFVVPGKFASDFCFSREHLFGISTLPDGFCRLSDKRFVDEKITTCTALSAIYPDVNDIRYRNWFSSTASGYVMSKKFGSQTLLIDYNRSDNGTTTDLPARIPFIKLGETALIAAECLNAQGNPSQALEWIDRLESTKNISFAKKMTENASVTTTEVEQLIEEEYRRDLFGEGQYFYYLKRKGKTIITDYANRTIQMDDKKYTLPIPNGAIAIE